ncbi:PREDICTED: probable myosin-binding protein 4 [Camelina sativa]|uniref:Probable myosin-binding protein 4 n=1 Tax=Camelina sativa TaxID=90675 RepID=A0ABM0Z4H3_CAMSA|nr:PREDICTED: probable myosin-binding protein 4 [Camelina sativa]
MDSNVIFDQKVTNGFTPVLTYAACEWFLIFLMFIDALLSYLLVWFARYCRLQMPCFLCSKLLHPLHWRFLLCRNHRSEVSSYMSCQNHGNNLADCRSMCDDCLLSFTKMTGPNPDMNRLLLGKLGYDLLSKSHFAHPRSCSCCNKPWRTRHHTQRLIRLGSRGRNSSGKPNIPAPRHLSRRGSSGSLKKMRDHKTTSGAEYADVGSRSDGMAHVGYSELKIHSDSDSEFLFSDDDALLQIADFNAEPSEKRVHNSRSRKSFEDKKMSYHKQPDLREDNQDKHIRKTSSMLEHNLVNKTRQERPVKAKRHDDALSELISMSEARPFLLGSPKKLYAVGAAPRYENEAEVSGKSSPAGGEFLSPSGDNGTSRGIQNEEHDDSADFAQNIPSSAVETEEFEAAMDVSGFVENEPSSDEENGVEGDSKPLASNDMSDSLEQEQSSEEENEVKENNVAEEYFSNEEEDEVSGHFEPLTSKDSSAEEQSSEEERASDGYSNAKDNSSIEEDVDNEESELLTSNNATGSVTDQSSEEEEASDGYSNAKDQSSKEDVDNEESELVTSNNVTASVTDQSSEEEGTSDGYSNAKDHSSTNEDVDNEESELVTSDNVTGSVTERSAEEEHGDHKETEPLTSPKISKEESELVTSNNVTATVTERSAEEEHGDHKETEPLTSPKISKEESELVTSDNMTGSVTERSAEEEHGDHKETEPLASPKITKEESSLEHSDRDSSKVTETRNTSNESPELKHSASVESLVSISSDIEGENRVDLLKQQLEHDRKCLREVTKELEEERSASAIATNQAMAMITRLQEEKAALHMEALQYLRMMDEQAEHDVDALERANDVLADREKEIQDLEMELEYYRAKYPDEPRDEILASMGILGNVEETSGASTDETSNKASTDIKLTGSPTAGN